MAHPLIWPTKTYFYPIGNTPATSFTQDLSPEESADVLLLGCGDPRSILYTIHSDLNFGTDMRKLDFTCCDKEPAIFARNVLLLTLITDGVSVANIWAIFYHFFLDQTSLDILVAQCRKLLQLSSDEETWSMSIYGQILKFCTSNTLAEVRLLWKLYIDTQSLPPKEKAQLKNSFTSEMKKVLADKEIGQAASYPAAGPLAFEMARLQLSHHKQFWTTGVTTGNSEHAPAIHLNPTFVYSVAGRQFSVHYGTDPFLSFHLAPVILSPSTKTTKDVVDYIRSQFASWCTSYWNRVSDPSHNLTIRFFVGEVLSVCRALHHCREGNILDTGIYTHPWSGTQISLNPEAYGTNGQTNPAPLKFNVIDTSNLTDHVGLLNILMVTIPLLANHPSSAIHTNTLLPSAAEGPARSGLADKACTDIPTLSVLLGVAPLPHLSHFTTHSNKHEILITSGSQIHESICWKIPFPVVPGRLSDADQVLVSPNRFSCDPNLLGDYLFSIYLKIFDDENTHAMLNPSQAGLRKQQDIHYLRASLATLFTFMKERLETGWTQAASRFIDRLHTDKTLLMTSNNFQDLCCHLYLRNLFAVDTFTPQFINSVRGTSARFHGWKVVPPVVCIVLKVPRHHLKVLEDLTADEIGTPYIQCVSRVSQSENIHPSIQVMFGDIQTSSKDGYPEVTICEDPKGWDGDSPLIVTFYMPSWMLLKYSSSSIRIALCVRSTPTTAQRLASKLGMTLILFSTPLTDLKHIQVTPKRPGNPEEIERLRTLSRPGIASHDLDDSRYGSVKANFNAAATKIVSVTIRHNITTSKAQESLADGAIVTTQQISDCVILVRFNEYEKLFIAPFPIRGNQSKTRVARKSHYIEVECLLRPHFEDSLDLSLNPFPVLTSNQTIALLNMPYLDPDRLPAIQFPIKTQKIEWLPIQGAMMFSEFEKQIREQHELSTRGALINLKESLHTIFLNLAALVPPNTRFHLFELQNPTRNPKTFALIFVNEMRLNLPSHSAVIDACVVPVTEANLINVDLNVRGGECLTILALEDEMLLWRMLLPAAAERCRMWSHTINCEYRVEGVPRSLEGTNSPICSCGEGKNLGAFRTNPAWKNLTSQATRIVLGPLFTFSFMDKFMEAAERNTDGKRQGSSTSATTQCARCGGPGKPTLSVCGNCKLARYCSRECQKAHWKIHKLKCGN